MPRRILIRLKHVEAHWRKIPKRQRSSSSTGGGLGTEDNENDTDNVVGDDSISEPSHSWTDHHTPHEIERTFVQANLSCLENAERSQTDLLEAVREVETLLTWWRMTMMSDETGDIDFLSGGGLEASSSSMKKIMHVISSDDEDENENEDENDGKSDGGGIGADQAQDKDNNKDCAIRRESTVSAWSLSEPPIYTIDTCLSSIEEKTQKHSGRLDSSLLDIRTEHEEMLSEYQRRTIARNPALEEERIKLEEEHDRLSSVIADRDADLERHRTELRNVRTKAKENSETCLSVLEKLETDVKDVQARLAEEDSVIESLRCMLDEKQRGLVELHFRYKKRLSGSAGGA